MITGWRNCCSRRQSGGRARPQRSLPDFAEVRRQLQTHKHLTLQLVWEEYRETQSDGYGYVRFCELYKRWSRNQDVVLRQEHRAGERQPNGGREGAAARRATCIKTARFECRKKGAIPAARQPACRISPTADGLPRSSVSLAGGHSSNGCPLASKCRRRRSRSSATAYRAVSFSGGSNRCSSRRIRLSMLFIAALRLVATASSAATRASMSSISMVLVA
jgi:hypothetical protein